MSYRNKYGITRIRTESYNNLVISWDSDAIGWNYQNNPKTRYPVLLYTPDMNDTNEHYHIDLTPTQARKLHKWLGDYLKDKARKRITKTRR